MLKGVVMWIMLGLKESSFCLICGVGKEKWYFGYNIVNGIFFILFIFVIKLFLVVCWGVKIE